jgi:DNA polymerase-1
VRLIQFAWDDGPVQLITDLEQARNLIREAEYTITHNGISADLGWIFGPDSLEPLELAMAGKVIDTFYLAHLVTPAPVSYQGRDGRWRSLPPKGSPVAHSMVWLKLDNLCYQFGIPGKIGDLKDLAKKYNPAKTLVANLDYSLIPLDDPDFLAYAEQDVVAVRALFKFLIRRLKELGMPGEYVWREMALMSATVGQMGRNGILVNQPFAIQELAKQAVKREEAMTWLVENYDFPTTGKAPWASTKGKEAVLRVLEDFGLTPKTVPDWPRTPTGALKQGGEDLMLVAEGTEAEEFVSTLASLKGIRSTHQQVMDNLQPDGRVHPSITSLQKSGRWSFTKPGVTIFGERSEHLRAEKEVFTAGPGKVLAGFDYSSADARAVAALSGDPEFAKRFETDENGNDLYDGHNLTGEALFGADAYYGDGPRGPEARPRLRAAAKMAGHAQNYNIGAYKLAVTLNRDSKRAGLDFHFWAPARKKGVPEIERFEDSLDTTEMIEAFNEAYPWVKWFKDDSVREAQTTGYIKNSWGRWMKVDTGREYTQGPALYGQSATRELMGDAILRLIREGEYYVRALRAIIHDELLMEFDEATIERDIAVVKRCMEASYNPGTEVGMTIAFPVGVGWGKTWKDAGH